jgi:transcriptional regulator with XRE-family HTH domain
MGSGKSFKNTRKCIQDKQEISKIMSSNLTMKQIREQLKWSFAEMADALNLSRSTYQSYDEERRATPPEVLKLAQETLERSLSHSIALKERYMPGGEVDQELAKKYPYGIISGIGAW